MSTPKLHTSDLLVYIWSANDSSAIHLTGTATYNVRLLVCMPDHKVVLHYIGTENIS
jgi:hypothetical protein